MGIEIPSWVISLISTLFGAVIGVCLEPVKMWWVRRSELKLARKEIYSELAHYIAGMERVQSGIANSNQTRLAYTGTPDFSVIAWYKVNRFDFLLRLDKKGGIREMERAFMDITEAVHRQSIAQGPLPEIILTYVKAHEKDFDAKLLCEHIATAHQEYAASQEALDRIEKEE